MDWASIFGNAIRSAFGTEAATYALAAIGLNIHYGYTGLLNFGHVAYMLVGAYGLGVSVATFGLPFWVGVLVAVLASVVLSLILGLPTLRLRADYFAIATIAVAEVLRLLVRSRPAEGLTGATFGLQGIASTFYAINPFPPGSYGIGPVSYTDTITWMLVVTWALVALSTVMVFLLMRSPWGRVIKSIREDEDATRSLGKNVFGYKMQSLILGGVFGALGGLMLAVATNGVTPDAWQPQVTFFLFTLLILGGAATRLGPVVGSIMFWFLIAGTDALLREANAAGYVPDVVAGPNIGALRFILVGLILVLLMVYRPQGMFGSRRELLLDA